MANGLGAGAGLASGLATGFNTVDSYYYHQGLLDLENKRQQQVDKNQKQTRYMESYKAYMDNLAQTIDADKIQTREMFPHLSPEKINDLVLKRHADQIAQAKSLFGVGFKHLGMDDQPAIMEAQIGTILQRPASSATEGALARAKEGPQKQQLVQTEIERNQAQTKALGGVNPTNPDLDTGTQLGGAIDPMTGKPPSAMAQAIGTYKQAPLSVSGRYNQQNRSTMEEVFRTYPNYNSMEYRRRQKAELAEPTADTQALTQLTKSRESIQAFSDTTIANGEVLVDLAKKVDKTGVPVFERWLRAGRQSVMGDEDVSNFNFQYQMWSTDAARVIQNPNLTGQLTDTARAELQAAAQPNANLKQIEGAVKLAKADAARRIKGLDDSIGRVKGRLKGEKTGQQDSGAEWEEVPGMPGIKRRVISP